MRQRLLASTVGIAVICVVILGLPLVLLARHQVWTSARDHVRDQAASIATGLEDRLDTAQPVELGRYEGLTTDRRIVVRPEHGPAVTSGPPLAGRLIAATVRVGDGSVTVEARRGPTATRAREVSLVVVGLAVGAVLVAVALALWQTRRLATPIAELVERADALGGGAFASEPLRSGVPEIDALSHVLERSASRIGTLVDLQEQFASDAAHQLRTPLTSIGLHLDEIAHLGDAPVRSEADEAIAQVERLNAVITSLLARARGDVGPPTLIDLARLARDGAAAWRRVLGSKHRQLHRDLTPGTTVLARREHVLGVLASLLDNAVAHGHGDVWLRVTRTHDAAVLRVHDEGPGVPAHLRSAIFERRFSGREGSGIGLALAKSLATAESGSLGVSPVNPAEFVFTLPLARQPPAG